MHVEWKQKENFLALDILGFPKNIQPIRSSRLAGY